MRKLQIPIISFAALLICGTAVNGAPQDRRRPDVDDLNTNSTVKWGYVDHSFRFAIPPKYDQVTPFENGFAWVNEGKDNSLIDKSGKVMLTVHGASSVQRIVENIAGIALPTSAFQRIFVNQLGQLSAELPSNISIEFVNLASPTPKILPELTAQVDKQRDEERHKYTVPDSGRAEYNLFNKLMYESKPQKLRDEDWYWRGREFSEGLVRLNAHVPATERPRQCFMDMSGELKIVLPQEVLLTGNFHDGMAPILVNSDRSLFMNPKIERLLGYIDKTGKIVIPPHFHMQGFGLQGMNGAFSEGVAVLHLGDDIVIDKHGTVLKTFPRGSFRDFSDGLAPHAVLVEKAGKLVSPDDSSCGYQSDVQYESAVIGLLNAQLKDTILPRPVEFDIVPDELRGTVLHDTTQPGGAVLAENGEIVLPPRGIVCFPGDRRELLIRKLARNVDKRFPEARSNYLHRNWNRLKQSAEGMPNEDPDCTKVRERIGKIKLPKRSIRLKCIVLHLVLENGKVHSKSPPTIENPPRI